MITDHRFELARPWWHAAAGTGSSGSLFLKDIVVSSKPGAHVGAAAVRQAMASVDPGMPILSVRTVKEKVELQFAQQRLIARLTSFFGVLSLVLASVNLYGVIAHDAGRRIGEVGIRIALGATRGDVVRLVLTGAIWLIGAGLSIGLPLMFLTGRLLQEQLYGINPYDPPSRLQRSQHWRSRDCWPRSCRRCASAGRHRWNYCEPNNQSARSGGRSWPTGLDAGSTRRFERRTRGVRFAISSPHGTFR